MKGEQIKELRKQAGYTQTAFAQKCDMQRKHYQRIESGELPVSDIKMFTAYKIAKTLGISLDELYSEGSEFQE